MRHEQFGVLPVQIQLQVKHLDAGTGARVLLGDVGDAVVLLAHGLFDVRPDQEGVVEVVPDRVEALRLLERTVALPVELAGGSLLGLTDDQLVAVLHERLEVVRQQVGVERLLVSVHSEADPADRLVHLRVGCLLLPEHVGFLLAGLLGGRFRHF